MTTRAVEITAQAVHDIADIHRHGRHEFGKVVAHRYRALIALGIETLADEPAQRTARSRTDLLDGVWSYHLRHARQTGLEKIASPRHLLIFAYDVENVRILRVLHDAMDLSRHV